MLWVLAVVLIGACVVVAAGGGGAIRETYDDRRDVLVPGDRPLGAEDLRSVRFTTAFRGYRMAEVDALLARLAAELDTAHRSGTPGAERPTGAARRPDRDPTAFARRTDGGGRAG